MANRQNWKGTRSVITVSPTTISVRHLPPLHEEEHNVKQAVEELAYILYEERGREDGHDLADWFEAEAALASVGS